MMGGSEPVSPLDSYADLAGRAKDRPAAAAAAAAAAVAASNAAAAATVAAAATAAARPPKPPTPAADAAAPDAAETLSPSSHQIPGNCRGAAAPAAAVSVPGHSGAAAGAAAANGRSGGDASCGSSIRDSCGSAPARLGGAQELAAAMETASISSGAYNICKTMLCGFCA